MDDKEDGFVKGAIALNFKKGIEEGFAVEFIEKIGYESMAVNELMHDKTLYATVKVPVGEENKAVEKFNKYEEIIKTAHRLSEIECF